MRRLTIIVATGDAERFHGALQLAAAWAALDRPARLFLQPEAVRLLAPPATWDRDQTYRAAGLPALGELLEEALALGVSCTACQSGLALAALRPDDLPEGVETDGLVSLLRDAEEDRLLLV